MKLRKRRETEAREMATFIGDDGETTDCIECDVWVDDEGNTFAVSPKKKVLRIEVHTKEENPDYITQKLAALKNKSMTLEQKIDELESLVRSLAKRALG